MLLLLALWKSSKRDYSHQIQDFQLARDRPVIMFPSPKKILRENLEKAKAVDLEGLQVELWVMNSATKVH